jgi:hypothetical protein
LPKQVSVQPLKFPVVLNPLFVTQAPGQRRFHEAIAAAVLIQTSESIVDHSPSSVLVDAGALDLQPYPQFASMPNRRLGSGDGRRHAGIVDRSLLAKLRNGVVDQVGLMSAPGESLAQARLGQIAAREHLQAVDVRRIGLMWHLNASL